MRTRVLTLLAVSLLVTACKPSPEETAKQQAAELAALKKRMKPIAQAAADNNLFSKRACIRITGEGRLWKTEDVDILPDTRLWRFLESQNVAVRQTVKRNYGGDTDTRFYIREIYRDNIQDNDKYCFGRWAILDVSPVKQTKGTKRNGVTMFPFDVTMRLTQIPTQEWLESRIIRENLTGGMTSLTKDYKIRAQLPLLLEQLPPPDNAKPLDQ